MKSHLVPSWLLINKPPLNRPSLNARAIEKWLKGMGFKKIDSPTELSKDEKLDILLKQLIIAIPKKTNFFDKEFRSASEDLLVVYDHLQLMRYHKIPYDPQYIDKLKYEIKQMLEDVEAIRYDSLRPRSPVKVQVPEGDENTSVICIDGQSIDLSRTFSPNTAKKFTTEVSDEQTSLAGEALTEATDLLLSQ